MNYFKLVDKQLCFTAIPLPFNRATIIIDNAVMRVLLKFVRDKNIKISKATINGYNDMPFKTEIFTPTSANDNAPCLIYYHGGSFCYCAVPAQKQWAMNYAKKANCKIIFPDYHLAPKYRYPAGIEDCKAAYKWAHENSEVLGIDKNKIGVAGDSAGGTLAAMVSNSAKKMNLPIPCLQLLVYPCADETMTSESMKTFKFSPVWNAYNHKKIQPLYYDREYELSEISLVHANLPDELPPTYIETAEYDCLRDEGIAYAKKLENAGAKVILNETKGTFHGYDAMGWAKVAKDSMEKRFDFLNMYFNKQD